jgi:hypothetical protein
MKKVLIAIVGALLAFGVIMIATGHSNTCAHPVQVGQSQVCQ